MTTKPGRLKGQAASDAEKAAHERFEPMTCATAHFVAERVMRIIETIALNGVPGARIDAKTIDGLERVAERAGVYFARQRIDDLDRLYDDIPF